MTPMPTGERYVRNNIEVKIGLFMLTVYFNEQKMSQCCLGYQRTKHRLVGIQYWYIFLLDAKYGYNFE